jgi:hypothetical protein
MKMTTGADLRQELEAASAEYDAAYRDYEAATRMNVPDPEGIGTFGGVWDCDQGRLLRALAGAMRRLTGNCSPAVARAVTGGTVTVADWDYGELAGAPAADVYRVYNGSFRDPSGRYLTDSERAALESAVGDYGRAPGAYGARKFAKGAVFPLAAKQTRPDYYYAPGRVTQRFIEEVAGDQVARTLTKPYIVGWPVCSDRQKIDAYRRVANIYRVLADEFAKAAP